MAVPRPRILQKVSIAVALAVAIGACASATASTPASSSPLTLRLGYFANITHAPALVGIESGILATALGPDVTLKPITFSAGPSAVEALFSESIDAAYIGPNPAINAFAKSHGEAIRIVSGVTSGGAFLVVRDAIRTTGDLHGARLATPQLGGTQDVALRSWLRSNNLAADTNGGGDVSVLPQDNSRTLEAMKSGAIDGAWVPEPWATRLIQEANAHVLIDERDLWPNGQYPTTLLAVRTDFLVRHPEVVRRLIEGNLASIDYINDHPAEAQKSANSQIKRITQKTIKPSILTSAWPHMTFTADPTSRSLQRAANDEVALGFITPVDLQGIMDLTLLNEVLATHGRPSITQP